MVRVVAGSPVYDIEFALLVHDFQSLLREAGCSIASNTSLVAIEVLGDLLEGSVAGFDEELEKWVSKCCCSEMEQMGSLRSRQR